MRTEIQTDTCGDTQLNRPPCRYVRPHVAGALPTVSVVSVMMTTARAKKTTTRPLTRMERSPRSLSLLPRSAVLSCLQSAVIGVIMSASTSLYKMHALRERETYIYVNLDLARWVCV